MTLSIATTIDEVRRAVGGARQRGQTIGLVPTMGALHAGHASLIKAAREATGFVVVSIFVNPTQFGPNEDFTRYPRALDKDLALCAAHGVDLVFAPEPASLYPPNYRTFVEVTELQDGLCGAARPGHFRGVATVVLKLFNIVQPDAAFFGQKDAQQARLLKRMALDLDVPIRIVVCPIVREPDGLALSSRNQYLDAQQRRHATVLYRSLQEAQERILVGERDAAALLGAIRSRIEATPGARLDYAALVDAYDLKPTDSVRGRTLVALAVWFGTTRLIDNVLLDVADP